MSSYEEVPHGQYNSNNFFLIYDVLYLNHYCHASYTHRQRLYRRWSIPKFLGYLQAL